MIASMIKVGGSLNKGESLPQLCRQLGELGARHPLLIVPGGGPFADIVRLQDRRYGLKDSAAHWMAILAMDQYGWLLADLIPRAKAVLNLADAHEIAGSGRVPILLPSALLYGADPLPHSWDVTSDSIAAWIAGQAGAQLLVLLKDVDGLYADAPKAGAPPSLRKTITGEQLASCDGVDAYLSKLMPHLELKLWIINGERPERLAELVLKGATIGTRYQPPAF